MLRDALARRVVDRNVTHHVRVCGRSYDVAFRSIPHVEVVNRWQRAVEL